MAQAEDTELRDLVIDALEKNGSLAKVRALLRANIFLAFEEECENMKHNPILDNVLQMPEGILSLSLVHEFLEYCNLRNTMFVYVSETRQGKEYTYDGRRNLADRFANLKGDLAKEPILVTIIKKLFKTQTSYPLAQDHMKRGYTQNMGNGVKDEQNCTYIVHEDSSSVSSHSHSQSDNSLDEKNKLLLRLPLDNSDTDTSSDSTRDKTSSEYIANENIIVDADSDDDSKKSNRICPNLIEGDTQKNLLSKNLNEHYNMDNNILALTTSSLVNPSYVSSDSTSYLDIQVGNKHHKFSEIDEIVEAGNSNLGIGNTNIVKDIVSHINNVNDETRKSETLLRSSPRSVSQSINYNASNKQEVSVKNDSKNFNFKKCDDEVKPDIVMSDYSCDFSASPQSSRHDPSIHSSLKNERQLTTNEIPKQELNSSHSSVSISDVADLIENSDLSSPVKLNRINFDELTVNKCEARSGANKANSSSIGVKSPRDDSEEFSVSSIPSLSNLSLDFHSE